MKSSHSPLPSSLANLPRLPRYRSSPAPTTTLDDLAALPSATKVHASTTASIYSHLSQQNPGRDNISALLRQGNGHSAASTSLTTLSSSPPYSPLPLFVAAEENSNFEISIEVIEPLALTEKNLAEHNLRESDCEPMSYYLLRRSFEHARINGSEGVLDPDADYVSQGYQSSLSVSSLL